MKTDMVGCGFGHLTEVQPMECEVCGREVCECPHPLGECAECSRARLRWRPVDGRFRGQPVVHAMLAGR